MTRYLYGGLSEQAKASIRRKADARVLSANSHWRGAMYLMGYAVECRLKASLMEKFDVATLDQLELVLQKKFGGTINIKDHSIERLFDLFEMDGRLIDRDGNDANLRAFNRCNSWQVSWRYRPDSGNEEECRGFFQAVERFLHFLEHNI